VVLCLIFSLFTFDYIASENRIAKNKQTNNGSHQYLFWAKYE